jgi:hypothetical protein
MRIRSNTGLLAPLQTSLSLDCLQVLALISHPPGRGISFSCAPWVLLRLIYSASRHDALFPTPEQRDER